MLAVSAIVGIMLTSGCTSSGRGGAGAHQSPSAHAPTSSASPGKVALEYTKNYFSGNTAAARSLVLPASRNAYDYLVTSGGRISATAVGLAAASTSIVGKYADVTLTGKLCHASKCIENTDPHSKNGIFITHLEYASGRWQVWFPGPAK